MWKTIFLLLLPLTSVFATGDSLRYLLPRDTVFLAVDATEEKIFEHQIVKGQTLFSLSKFYGISVDELSYFNPTLRAESLKIGQKIRIPIPNRAILRYKEVNRFNRQEYAPVYYVVRKGDTIFRISRYYFRMPADTILTRSGLLGQTLRPGQLLLVGWMSVKGIPEDYHVTYQHPLVRKNFELRKIYRSYDSQNKKEREEQGPGFWQEDPGASNDNFFALSNTAPLRSVIEITNPMTNRTFYAKVLGRIPASAYPRDIVVVVSPGMANILGAKDPRFFVKIKYYR